MQVKLWTFLAAFSPLMACFCNKQNDETYSSDALFEAVVLNTTNAYRQVHNASDLFWNQTLSEYAQRWSKNCELRHSGGPYGENLAMGYSDVSAAITAWSEEREQYDFDKAQYSNKTGHFTQLVWKATTSVGCGRSNCYDGSLTSSRWLIVCNYYEAGNMLGGFAQNVQRLLHAPHNKTTHHSKPCATKELEYKKPASFRVETTNLTIEHVDASNIAINPIRIDFWIVWEEH